MEETKNEMRTVKRGKFGQITNSGLAKSFAQLDGLTCSICMDYIVSCRTAVCGHSFCEECITESLIRKKECPHCRKDIRKWVLQKSEIVDTAVKILIDTKRENGEEEEARRMEERLKNHCKWLEKHKV